MVKFHYFLSYEYSYICTVFILSKTTTPHDASTKISEQL